MSQLFDSLQSYSLGSMFSGSPFTLQTGPGGDWTYNFVDIGGGVKAIRITRTATAQAFSRILWQPSIQTVSTTGALEVYARVSKNTTADANVPIGPCLIFSDGRVYAWRSVTSGATWRLGLFSNTGTHNTSIGSAAISFAEPSDQTPFHMVIGVRIDPGPTRVIYGKLWLGDVDDEGSAVSMEGANATLNDLSPGIAVLDSSDVPYQFYALGIGNAGDAALREALAEEVQGDLAATDGPDVVAISGTVEGAAPTVIDVDEDNAVTATQTNVEIDGSAFNAATLEIRQGAVEVAQSIDSQDVDTITFDVVFDAGAGPHLKYGSALAAVINDDDQEDTHAITIDPPSGFDYVDLDTPNTTAENRITAVTDLAAGDQLEISNVQGGTIADVTVNADATFDATEGVTAFDVRAWDSTDATWGDVATQSVSGPETEGDLAATDGPDVVEIAGTVEQLPGVEGDLAATDGADVAAIAGEVDIQGAFAGSEAPDTAAVAGDVLAAGDLAATDGPDVAAISGTVEAGPIEGNMDATEGPDVCAIVGEVPDYVFTITSAEGIARIKARETLRSAIVTRHGTYAKRPEDVYAVVVEFVDDLANATLSAAEWRGSLNNADRLHVNGEGSLPLETEGKSNA